MRILQHISELLLCHDCVIIPGFGGFIATQIPAGIQPVINSFTPPRKEILFNPGIRHNDGLLATHIAQKENISYSEAVSSINKFVEESMQQLKDQGKFEILHVGTIFMDSSRYFSFQQDKDNNLLLSSFGLSNFISPAIQREGLEKRIEKVIAENRKLRPEGKSTNLWAKAAMITVPAAAIFVWAFVNVGNIRDVADNYTNLTSIFSGSGSEIIITARPGNNSKPDFPKVYENAYDVANSKGVFNPEEKTIYPCFEEFTPKTQGDANEKNSAISEEPSTGCKIFVIGSCNRNKDLAENYKSRLIAKGYQNANIIEPKGNGLYKVYIDCFDSEESAKAGLSSIQDNENPEAWLLKM